MITRCVLTRPASEHQDELSGFCHDLFGSLPRSDQRKWAEVYVRGLLTVRGRKSIRRIADQVVGARVDQCLQQFVNQSPWPWEPVRRQLAQRAVAIEPRAVVAVDVAIPKSGASSVGVARQFATSAGRTLNCQLGLAIFLANEQAGCAVNWRLMLPKCWDDDAGRRARARLPRPERHRPRWQYLLDAIDELCPHWNLPRVPVILDTDDRSAAAPLVHGLVDRGLNYVLRVPQETSVRLVADQPGAGRVLAAGELAALSVRSRRSVLAEPVGPCARRPAAHYSLVSLRGADLPTDIARITSMRPDGRVRQVLAEWLPGAQRPRSVWLTNLNVTRPAELVRLITLGESTKQEGTARLRDDFGLQQFEGRSFAGWHHHMTLVSAAHAHWTLHQLRQRQVYQAPAWAPA
jgi:hypothetical protein